MQVTNFFRYAKKIAQIGPKASFDVLKNKVKKKQFYNSWKYTAERGAANHTWEIIAYKQNVSNEFSVFFEKLKKTFELRFPETILDNISCNKNILEEADGFVKKQFDILGSGLVTFENINWHQDFKLSKQCSDLNCFFDKKIFYQDIAIQAGNKPGLSKDIKIPWELSRCYHFSVLGAAYDKTKQEIYEKAFVEQVTSWIDQNRFMIGVNWACPMEVAIRAINWISAFYYFKDSDFITIDFWEMFVSSLYDHFFYLENNWEIYDSRTSNHYLSDLVGYFYLSFFFSDFTGIEEKQEWCYKEILKEFDKQISDDGTDYEGSTSYHCLVAELFYLFSEISEKNEMDLPDVFCVGLKKMFTFIDFCKINKEQIITVGDNDSGKILYSGIVNSIIDKYKNKVDEKKVNFYNFGLSIIKNKRLHLSLRHHVYNKSQPSGHFHNDAGSVTLAVDGIPVFVDSGSFVYTSSVALRNRFRSIFFHNSFYISGNEFVHLDDHLFFLDLFEKKMEKQPEGLIIKTSHNFYKQLGITATRTVSLNEKKNIFIFKDEWQSINNENNCLYGLLTEWNFTVHPGIKLVRDGLSWIFFYNEKKLLTMTSSQISFKAVGGLYSPGYGKIVSTQRLFACSDIGLNEPVEIIISL